MRPKKGIANRVNLDSQLVTSERKVRFLPSELRSAARAYVSLKQWMLLRRRRLLLMTLTFTDAKTTFATAAQTWKKFSRKFLSPQNSVAGWFRVIEGYDLPPWAFRVVLPKGRSKKPFRTVRGKGLNTHIHALVEMAMPFAALKWSTGKRIRLVGPSNIVSLWRRILRGKSQMGIGVVNLVQVNRTPAKLARYLTDEVRTRGRASRVRDSSLKGLHIFEFSRRKINSLPLGAPKMVPMCR